jgi:hypothetical protein
MILSIKATGLMVMEYLGKRKGLVLFGYALSALTKPS